MSLAVGGGLGGGMGGAGAGGMAMAHQANAVARPTAPNVPPGSAIPGMAPPSSAAAALGADLVDKSQQISLRQVKDLSALPLVAVDLFASEPQVAFFPPKNKDPAAPMAAALVGKMKDKLVLKKGETPHKTFRKYLSQEKGHQELHADVLTKSDDKEGVVIASPQKWLGLRRLADAPKALKKGVVCDESTDKSAIAETASHGVGVSMTNGTLDGSSPQGDDFDRVVFQVRLNEKKKALSVLPEELVQILLNQAQHHVASATKASTDDDDIDNFPCSVAVPAVYCTDPGMDALMDATHGTAVIFQRSVAALVGALLPSAEKDKPNLFLEHTNNVRAARHKEYQREKMKDSSAVFDEDMLVLLCGVTSDTAECTAIQISALQESNYQCLFGNLKVLSNVSYKHERPSEIVDRCINELFDTLDGVAPESEGPVGMITYGTSTEQKLIQPKWDKLKKGLEDWEQVPHFFCKPDAVAMGTAVLGAVSHGRLTKVIQSSDKKPKKALAMEVQNVAPVAVGVQMNYHGGRKDKWEPVKTIFDFDRRVPAGPYDIVLNAAECVVHREGSKGFSDEQLLKAIKSNEGAGCIPKREEAALQLQVQFVEKWTRDGTWTKIGNTQLPLVMLDKDEKKIACERITLQIALGATGILTHYEVGERESVVQATKSARNNAIRWYAAVAAAILFFGGFLVKSWWEERVFDRDTRRLLAFYKHVLPGSMSDGDKYNARYVVWKYRGKKEKLWRSLSKKYGEPVLHEHEWPESEEEVTEQDEETENLDEQQEKKEPDQEPDL